MGSPPAIISLSRWYPLRIRGTFYGFFSASHNFGEGLSFIFVAALNYKKSRKSYDSRDFFYYG